MPQTNSHNSKSKNHSFSTGRMDFEFVDHFPEENEKNAVHDITNVLDHLGVLHGTKY